jgi:hypothetical protein
MSTPSVKNVLPMCVTDGIDQNLGHQPLKKHSEKTESYEWFLVAMQGIEPRTLRI